MHDAGGPVSLADWNRALAKVLAQEARIKAMSLTDPRRDEEDRILVSTLHNATAQRLLMCLDPNDDGSVGPR